MIFLEFSEFEPGDIIEAYEQTTKKKWKKKFVYLFLNFIKIKFNFFINI